MAGTQPFTVGYFIAVHFCKGPRCDSASEPLPTIRARSSDAGVTHLRVEVHVVQATTGVTVQQ